MERNSQNDVSETFIALLVAVMVLALMAGSASNAQPLPAPADAGRIAPIQKQDTPPLPHATTAIPIIMPEVTAPEASSKLTFRLNEVRVEGATAFSADELQAIYSAYIGKEITLDVIWVLAANITNHYRKNGYFLSRAYIPPQDIEDGVVMIKITEGYIGEVQLDHKVNQSFIVRSLINDIKALKPLKSPDLESFILTMNDLHGYRFSGTLKPIDDADEAAVALLLEVTEDEASGVMNLNNSGSRFIGPYQATMSYSDSFFPLHHTQITTSSTLPFDEMQYLALNHEAALAPRWKWQASGIYVRAKPGSILESSDVTSQSVSLSLGLNYQAIRQREENLSLRMNLDMKNTNSDILGDNPLIRDRIRLIRVGIDYDTADGWGGYHYLTMTLGQGIEILSASKKGDSNLSRVEAEADFTKIDASYIRQQVIQNNILLINQLSGQYASGPLFSSEEFGYGGQQYGRAYDSSEITGDHGVATSVELRYLGLDPVYDMNISPFVFYDIGKVWDEDVGGGSLSASSAGIGVHMKHPNGISGSLGLAWPLTKKVSNPVYGGSKSPRIAVQMSYSFE